MVHTKNSNTGLLDGIIDFTSGSLGAVALVYVGQPLDTVKVKMQTFPELYQGMWHCMRKTVRTEGVRRGLYAGTVPALAANVAENSVLFAAYGACQKVIAFATGTKDIQNLGILSNASAGFLAAFFSSFSLCPTELIKIKMQAAKEHAAQTKKTVEREGAFKITHKIFKTEGIMGLFRGIVPTMAREMPGYFFFFGGYEATRVLLTPEGKTKDECGALRTMAAGAVGGVSFWTAVFPFDVVKSRIQVGQISDGSLFKSMLTIFRNEGCAESLLEHVDVHELAGMVDSQLQQEVWTAPLEIIDKISTMYLEGRLRRVFTPEDLSRRFTAMYSGWTPTVVRTIPSTAVLFLVYETSRTVLNSLLGDVEEHELVNKTTLS